MRCKMITRVPKPLPLDLEHCWLTVRGSGNTAVGYNAGRYLTDVNGLFPLKTCSQCTFLGYNANAVGLTTDTGRMNATAIGEGATVSVDNALVLGAIGTSVGIGTSAPMYPLDVNGIGHFKNLKSDEGLSAQGITTTSNVTVGGNLTVNGSVNSNVKMFKIDDPLDPEHKYLYHASIESSEMKNMYDGVATLDANGEAVVELPAWFEALNRDFRYQLTAVGAPGPNLYIKEKVRNNRFRIGGGEPGAEVSWQVTGVRHDAWANAHPLQVEQEKSLAERGHD